MSRLDSAIDRLTAQRACLDWAATAVADLSGPVLELGLGNGRTYDHLRTLLPDRRIHVFERQVNAHLDCIPPDEDLFLGDFLDTLPGSGAVIGAPVALVHADTGTGEKTASVALAAAIVPLLLPLMATGAILVSDQPMQHASLVPVTLPAGIRPGRYHIYRNS